MPKGEDEAFYERVKVIGASFLIGWLALASEDVIYTFGIPHGPHFASDIGPIGGLLYFPFFETWFYAVAFVLVLVPFRHWMYSTNYERCALERFLYHVAVCGCSVGDERFRFRCRLQQSRFPFRARVAAWRRSHCCWQ